MNSLLEKPNLFSVFLLVGVLAIGIGYVAFTVNQRPEMESFTVDDDYDFPFNFDRVGSTLKLPKELEEISGLCPGRTPGTIYAIQDEDGELFVVNLSDGSIRASITFDKDRDYEGIARNDSTFYVLERDGDLHTFKLGDEINDSEVEAAKLETAFSYRNDTEGICYDAGANSLLIVPKERQIDPANDESGIRGIYRFDLKTNQLDPTPAYYVDESEVGRIVYGTERPYTIKPSGIAIDPVTDDIYVLSSVGNVLVVIDRDSQIKHVELLEKKVFRQPEGIAFGEDGELYISSEARGGEASIATLTRSSAGKAAATPTENE